ncbi:MAG: DUF2145 domain-containing protein [Phenylobacterium sp.]
MIRPAILGLAAAVAFAALPAAAQDSSAQAVAAHFTAPEAAGFSKQIERDLAGRGAQVALVFRTGRPRSQLPDGIRYTHGAFWVHREIATADGRQLSGYAVYNLYAGDGRNWPKAQSRLVQDYPFDFVRGSYVDDVAVIVPSPEMQRRILAVIDSPAYERLHNPAYSLVANPWAARYQNCTNFMLDVVGAAAWQTDDAGRITADLKAHYQPTVVKAGPLMRLFGPIADSRLRTDDQHGPIRTATYESVAAFMDRNGLLEAAYPLNFQRP